jgi:DNA-binding beta-propeller fold protein YncE
MEFLKKAKFFFLAFVAIVTLPLITGCGKLWGGVNFYRLPSSSTQSSYSILGLFVGNIGNTIASTGTCPAAGVTSEWCTRGTFASGGGDGFFNNPYGVAIDTSQGFLYVNDFGNNRVVKLNLSNGTFVGAIGRSVATTGTCPGGGVAAPGWCTGGTFAPGAGDGMFNAPHGLAIDPVGGYLYVSDNNNFRVQKINLTTGAFVGAIGRTTATTGTCPAAGAAPSWCTGGTFASGAADGMFSFPSGIFADYVNGFIYLADTSNRKVHKINLSTGAFIGAIGNTTATAGTCPAAGAAPGWCTGGTFAVGAGDGMFNQPVDVTADLTNGVVFVNDFTKFSVQKFSLISGTFVGSIGRTSASTGTCPAAGATTGWCTGGTFASGAGDGMFNQATGVTFDTQGNSLYVVNYANNRIDKFNAQTGGYVGSIGKTSGSTGTCPVGTTTCTTPTYLALRVL